MHPVIRHSRVLLAIACCALAFPASAAGKRYEAAAQQRALQSSAVLSGETHLRTLAAQRDIAGLVALADRLVAASATAPLESEYLLSQWLAQARAIAADAQLRAQVARLSNYQAKALTRAPEHHPALDAWVPVLDIGSLARGVLRTWALEERVATLGAAIESSDPASIRTDDAEALELAFAAASPAALARVRASGIALPSRAKVALAKNLRDPSLFVEILAGPLDEFAFVALADVTGVLAPADARLVLEQAARRPALASAATLAMGALAPPAPELIDCLPDPVRGGSCAQLLASRDDAATIDALATLGRGEQLANRRARLALLWNPAPRARAALADLADDPSTPAHTRAEVRRWLR